MKAWLQGALAGAVLALLGGSGIALAGEAGGSTPGSWALSAGGTLIAPEGGSEGYGAFVNLAWRTPYHSPGAPRSYFGLELELMETADSYTRRSRGNRVEGDLRTAGLFLAANTYINDKAFFRARLGGVYRYMDESHRDSRHQGRMAVGLGLGYSLTERLDLVTDAGLQYLGSELRLFYVGSAGLRVHF